MFHDSWKKHLHKSLKNKDKNLEQFYQEEKEMQNYFQNVLSVLFLWFNLSNKREFNILIKMWQYLKYAVILIDAAQPFVL